MAEAINSPAFLTGASVAGYCCLRLPVRELRRSVDFYKLVGYVPDNPDHEFEVLMNAMPGHGPGLFLMKAKEDEFKHIHWTHSGRLYTAFEILVDDINALHDRLKKAGTKVHTEPFMKGGYLVMDFFDPDGHYLFAVDRRARYISLKQDIQEVLGRSLSDDEDEKLEAACMATVANDEMWVIHTVISELRGARNAP